MSKRTAFHRLHKEMGAKLIDFGGYEMPIQYSGIIEEHLCVRNGVGVFDVSHMGEVDVRGTGALDFVQHVTTNDAARLVPGKAQYSTMCYPDGGIVDDLLVYRKKDGYMLVINAANTGKDIEWLKEHAGSFKVDIVDRSDSISLLAVQGPSSAAALRKLTQADLAGIPYYSCIDAEIAGVSMMISRTGYTGELGFELYFESSVPAGERVWAAIMDAGREFGIKPAGLAARDTLRLEMGYCLYGNDIDRTTNPLEAGLGWVTKTEKGDFVGRDALRKEKERGPARKLVGFLADDSRSIPRHGCEIRSGGRSLGRVTSGTMSPVLGRGIALGYVPRESSEDGTPVEIVLHNKTAAARVAGVPFIPRGR